MTRHPDSDDTFTIPPADREIICRALVERINRLYATVSDVRKQLRPLTDFIDAHGNWTSADDPAKPLLDEAQRVGALLDVIGVRS